MVELVIPVVAVLVGAVALTRIHDLRPSAPPARRAVAVAVWGIAVASVLLSPGVGSGITALTGVDNLTEPLARSFLMLGALGAQAIFLLTGPSGGGARSVRRRTTVWALAVAILWTCFLTEPAHALSRAYYAQYGRDPRVSIMYFTAVIYLGWCFVDLITGWRRFARRTDGPLHTGLALMALGATTGLLYVTVRTAGQLATWVEATHLAALSLNAGTVLAAVTGLLTVIGVVWPSVHDDAARIKVWRADYRASGRLYPLWRDLIRARPSLALEKPPGPVTDRLRLRDVHWRVYRRVIEIRDARLAMRGPLKAARRRARRKLRAAGITPRPAHVEGLALAETMTAAAGPRELTNSAPDHVDAGVGLRSLPRGGGTTSEPDDDVADPEGANDTDLASEVAYLSAVSQHHVHACAKSTLAAHPGLPVTAAEDPTNAPEKDS